MNCQPERPVHLSSHVGYFAGVGAAICQLERKKKKSVTSEPEGCLITDCKQEHTDTSLNFK